jgi:hypothetical protein
MAPSRDNGLYKRRKCFIYVTVVCDLRKARAALRDWPQQALRKFPIACAGCLPAGLPFAIYIIETITRIKPAAAHLAANTIKHLSHQRELPQTEQY